MTTEAIPTIGARLVGATTDIANKVAGAIHDAARVTGAGFDYLLKTALRESNLNPEAKAPTSSATGLFQFIDQTWLATLKESGPSLGYGKYASAIVRTESGRYAVPDPAMRREIMALRKDPAANSLMAGAFTNKNAQVLTNKLGRAPTDGELYIAHFMGANGATRLIKAAEANPNAKAANAFPKAARVNRGIFYDKAGGTRSLGQVYANLVAKHDNTKVPPLPPGINVAALAPIPNVGNVKTVTPAAPVQAVAATLPVIAAKPAAPAVDPATAVNPALAATPTGAFTPVMTAQAVTPAKPATPQAPLFLSMFQTEGRGAVAPVVRELWGRPVQLASAVTPAQPVSDAAPGQIGRPLDLFRFLRAEKAGTA